MDRTYNVHEAKTHLSELLERAQAGEDIIIAKANKPIVRLVALAPQRKKRVFGLNKGAIEWIAPDFDAPLPDEFWYGGPDDLVNQTLKEMVRSGAATRLSAPGRRKSAAKPRRRK